MLIDIAHNVVLYTEPKKKVSHYLCLFNLQFNVIMVVGFKKFLFVNRKHLTDFRE